ncbi:MAG: hypothetical protein WC683_14105 [bacterium]
MPYKVFKRGDQFCVFKLDAEGEPSEQLKCYGTKAQAERYHRALEANVSDMAPEGSLNALLEELDAAVAGSSKFPTDRDSRAWARWVFPTQVVVATFKDNKETLWRADWSRDAEGKIAFSEVVQVEEVPIFRPVSEIANFEASFAPAILSISAGDDEVIESTLVWEFEGKHPAIPTFANVNTELLFAEDQAQGTDPFLVVMPVARVGETSKNGRHYDENLVSAIERQLPGLGGVRGHVPVKDRGNAYPPEVVDWIGARRIGQTLWAKAYVPPGPTRDEIRRLKARGGKLATSIYGVMRRKVAPNGKVSEPELILESLDLAPPSRAALDLGGEFAVVSEIATELQHAEGVYAGDPWHIETTYLNEEELTMPTKAEMIAELTARDADLLPEAVRQAIAKKLQLEADVERVAELEAHNKSLTDQVAELTENLNGAQAKLQASEQSYAVITAEMQKFALQDALAKVVTIEVLRPVVEQMVQLRLLQHDSEAQPDLSALVTEIWDSEAMQPLREKVVADLSGPAASISAARRANGSMPEINWEERVAEIRRRAGLS